MEYLGGAGLGCNVNPMVLSLIYHIIVYDVFWDVSCAYIGIVKLKKCNNTSLYRKKKV